MGELVGRRWAYKPFASAFNQDAVVAQPDTPLTRSEKKVGRESREKKRSDFGKGWGAKIGRNVRIHPSVHVGEYDLLTIGDNTVPMSVLFQMQLSCLML